MSSESPEKSSSPAPANSPDSTAEAAPAPAIPKRILAIDIGGTKIKVLVSGETEPRKLPSGKQMTPSLMVQGIKELAGDWSYDAVSIGYPGLVGNHGPRSEPGNLGSGWVGFDFAAAFGCPARIINDAAMQALGSYDGGRMLFLGLGTGLGSALIAEHVIVTLELGNLVHGAGKTLGELLGRKGLATLGKKAWRELIAETVHALSHAFVTDYVVLGGGNSKQIKDLPQGARIGHNLTAFRGGFRLWHVDDVPTLSAGDDAPHTNAPTPDWRLI